LEHYKKIRNSTKISVTPGIHLTQGCHVQRPLMCGPSGWPAGQTPWPIGPTLQPPLSLLGGDALQEAVEWNPRLGVGGGRPANTLRIIDLIKLVTAPGTPINTPHADGIQHTTLYLLFSTCKSSGLIVEAQVKPCRELRVESSLRSSSGSSLEDR
jgi:hypothetical protein